jgi:PilZ domain
MPSPQRNERRDFRFPLHLPVLIKTALRNEMRTRSENISLRGILLSSAFSIPEGSTVEISVGVEHLADPGILLNARGRVLRVQPKATGDFSVAIQLEEAFRLPLSESMPASSNQKEAPGPESRKRAAAAVGGMLAPPWHTET